MGSRAVAAAADPSRCRARSRGNARQFVEGASHSPNQRGDAARQAAGRGPPSVDGHRGGGCRASAVRRRTPRRGQRPARPRTPDARRRGGPVGRTRGCGRSAGGACRRPITRYRAIATPSDGSTPITCTAPPAANGCTITDLPDNIDYTVTVSRLCPPRWYCSDDVPVLGVPTCTISRRLLVPIHVRAMNVSENVDAGIGGTALMACRAMCLRCRSKNRGGSFLFASASLTRLTACL